MNNIYKEKRVELSEYIKKVEYYKYTLNSLLYWDKITHMPSEGIGYRSEVMGFLGEELYKMLSSKYLQELIIYFEGNLQNDKITNSMIKKLSRSSMYVRKIPQAEYRDYIQLIANAEQVWEKAREEDDFLMIQPYLERLIVHYKNFAKYWGYSYDPYDAWLGYYEEGMDTRRMDELIDIIKPAILELLEKIKDKTKFSLEKNEGVLKGYLNISKDIQMVLTKKILQDVGFSFKRGSIDKGAHTTILSNSPMDVRLVTSLDDENLQRCILNAMYLGGKGMYEQNIDCDLLGTMLAEVSSFALEEGIGRLYENSIGKSRAFWEYITPILKSEIPYLEKVGSDDLFAEVNRVNITSIRLEADELTNMLHIIMRYELERELISGDLSVSELPEAWNRKCEEYLKIQPQNYSDGVLQDIHWVAGYFGYFASYLFAGMVSAQFAHFIQLDTDGFEQMSGEERFRAYSEWLSKKVYKFGGIYNSAELVENACKEPINAEYYVSYLKERFSEVYKL